MSKNFKYQLLLHVIVFIWGFTGILGKLIELDAPRLVAVRMAVATVGLLLYLVFAKVSFAVTYRNILRFAGVGAIVALHWITFFGAIKVSNVSVALSCMASATLFSALIEPLFFKRRIQISELIFGFMVIVGLLLIFNFESQYALGILLAVISSMLAALFTVLNGLLIKDTDARIITFYEMASGFLVLLLFVIFTSGLDVSAFALPPIQWFYLILLGLVCTAFAFAASVYVLKELTPFTVTISVNMEPVYAILLALIIFGESERMTTGFYFGAAILIASVVFNAILKHRKNKLLINKPIAPNTVN